MALLFRSLVLLVLLAAAGCFPKKAGPKLAHFVAHAPAVGEPAPHFALNDLEGNRVDLWELLERGPVVVQLGSHSCPVYRYRRHSMRGLIEEFEDRVSFVLVYVTEAHPAGSKSPFADGEWNPLINRAVGVFVAEAATLEQRRNQAETSRERLNLERLLVIDEMDNAIWQAYGSGASPAFVIDSAGVVRLQQPWVDPGPIRETLAALLTESGTKAGASY